jgi:hypothetical protein
MTYIMTTVETKVTTTTKALEPRIPIEQWGKDHWSTFAYIETRYVDHEGIPNIRQMRCDSARHPQFSHIREEDERKYPTRYKGGELQDHDDWDCLDDCELAGLVETTGTGLHPRYKLTALGRLVAAQLRQHKANDGCFHDFVPKI